MSGDTTSISEGMRERVDVDYSTMYIYEKMNDRVKDEVFRWLCAFSIFVRKIMYHDMEPREESLSEKKQ